eukprot:397575_1
MQTRGNVISFCVLGLPPTHRSSSKKTVIELYSSYQEISRLIANSSCASIGSYSQLVSNQYSLSQLSNSIVLDDNINVYARTLNESGNKYLCVIYYKDVPFIHSLKKSSNLQLLDESISTFIALLTHNKSNVSTNVLTNIQSCIDLLSSINAQYSHDARDLVYWDNRCKHYTQTVTKSTLNKQPIATTPFKSQPYYSQDTPTHTRRHGLLFDDPKYTKRQRYKPRNNQSYNDTPRGYERSKSYHSIKKNTITPPQYKWSRKSTTDITDIEQANAKETEAKQADVETPKPSSKYDTTLSQLTKDFSELSQLVSELQLNTKDEEEDQENDEDREPPKNNGNVLQLNKGLVQSGAGIQQSMTAKIDEEADPNVDFVSNATVVIHEDDLKEREEDRQTLHETDQERRSRAHHRRSKPRTRRVPQASMSDTLIEFHLKCKKAGEVKQKLITQLKGLLHEVETDVLASFDESSDSLDSGQESVDSAHDKEDPQAQEDKAKLEKLRTLCTSFVKAPSSRVADGLVLMKNIFEAFTSDEVMDGEHIALYNQVFGKVVKHIPYTNTTQSSHGLTLTPLLSPSASASTASSLSDVISSAHRPYSSTQTPFNTPNMSRCTSGNSPTQTMPLSVLRVGSGDVKIFDEDFASNIPIRKRGGRHRSRSSVDDVMNECDDALKQHYHAMMGTIGDDAAFKQKLKHLLVEVANNYSKSDEEEPEPMNTPQAQVTRQSLKIKQIKTDFVTEIINAERDEEIQDKYWNKLSWNFDPISFGEHAKVAGNTVVLLGWHLIRMNGWHTEFKVAPHKLITFLYQIQEAYHNDNWYHNKYHAADVMNNMYWYMTKCTSMDKHLDAFDRFIGVMAAVCHDVDHNGYNNSYHQRTKSYLAIRYNDQSILENHHISYSFKLISSDAHYNWISDLKDTALIERARKYLIRLILGTDMSLHKKHLNQIQTLKKKLVTDDGETVVMSEDDKINLLAIILHAADIANAAKTRSLCVEWAKRCVEEFRTQGDHEVRCFGKLPPNNTLLFDRKHPLETSQEGWIKFVMLPYFKRLNKLLQNEIDHQIENLNSNLKYWTEYEACKDDSKDDA